MKEIKTEDCKIIQPHFPENAVISNDKRKIFSFEEMGKKYQAKNVNERIGICLQIDGALYSSSDGKKCDKGLFIEDGRFFLIELKGCNTEDACIQIISTYKKIKNDYSDYNFYARIISRKSAPRDSSKLKMAKKIFRKNFRQAENSLTESI